MQRHGTRIQHWPIPVALVTTKYLRAANGSQNIRTSNMKIVYALSLVAGVLAAIPAPNCPPRPTKTAEQTVIFEQFVNSFYVKKNITEAFLNHVAESYIQHNPNFKSGRDIALNGLKGYIPGNTITIVGTSVSDSRGWVLVKNERQGQPGYTAVLDVYRFDGTCIVEHWDLAQPKPVNATNPLALFDGQTFPKWSPTQAGAPIPGT